MESKTQGYTIVTDAVVEKLGLSKAYFLSRLLRWKDYKGTESFQVSDSVLAEECQLSDRSVRNYKKSLKEEGYIEYKSIWNGEGGYTVTKYTINRNAINNLLKYEKYEAKKAPEVPNTKTKNTFADGTPTSTAEEVMERISKMK